MKAETVEAVRQTARKIMREYSREDIFQIADLMTTGIIAALAFQFGVRAAMNAIYDGAALILGLRRAAKDTRTVDDGDGEWLS